MITKAQMEDFILEEVRERDMEARTTKFDLWVKENKAFLEGEFAEEKKDEFDDFCKCEYESWGED